MMLRLLAIGAVILAAAATGALPARALDHLNVATGGAPSDWDTGASGFGEREGFFKDKGIEVTVIYTAGGGATQQAVISGSADLGIAVSPAGALGAAAKGAPIKIISRQYTGGLDMLWYVRSESPIHSLKDITDKATLAYSSNGSSSNILGLAMLRQVGAHATMVATGGDGATLTQVMSGQIDVGYNTDGGLTFGPDRDKLRVLGTANDITEIRDLTVRVIIANADSLANRRDVMIRYMQAYQQTLDWMYKDQKALQWYAEQKHVPLAEAKRVRDLIYPEAALQLGPVTGVASIIQQAVDFKRIDAPITPAQFAQYVDLVWTPAK
jgi:NitT/TauT family transport system substrate-binding protein